MRLQGDYSAFKSTSKRLRYNYRKALAQCFESDYKTIAQQFNATVMRLQGDYSAFKATSKRLRNNYGKALAQCL